jgi:hypothetical protein
MTSQEWDYMNQSIGQLNQTVKQATVEANATLDRSTRQTQANIDGIPIFHSNTSGFNFINGIAPYGATKVLIISPKGFDHYCYQIDNDVYCH